MKVTKLDVTVSVLAGLACLFFYMPNPVTVWALFVGWAWYFNLGATPKAFAIAIPPMIMGYVLASVAVVAAFMAGASWVIALVIALFITVFIMMMAFKTKMFYNSLVAFVSYAIMFGGFYGQSGFGFPFLTQTDAIPPIGNIVVIALWMMFSNVIGLCFGWLSVTIANLGKK